jgi:hypothetical protein
MPKSLKVPSPLAGRLIMRGRTFDGTLSIATTVAPLTPPIRPDSAPKLGIRTAIVMS